MGRSEYGETKEKPMNCLLISPTKEKFVVSDVDGIGDQRLVSGERRMWISRLIIINSVFWHFHANKIPK